MACLFNKLQQQMKNHHPYPSVFHEWRVSPLLYGRLYAIPHVVEICITIFQEGLMLRRTETGATHVMPAIIVFSMLYVFIARTFFLKFWSFSSYWISYSLFPVNHLFVASPFCCTQHYHNFFSFSPRNR